MMATGREHCAFARDGLCRFPPEHCRECKIEPEDSAFHKRLVCGGLTWEEIREMQERWWKK